MSCYIDFTLNCTTYDEVISALMEYTRSLDNYYDIENTINIIHVLEDLKDEYNAKQNKELKEYVERQKLFEEKINTDEYFLFNDIKEILNSYNINEDVETEFHLIMEIIDKMNNRLNNK